MNISHILINWYKINKRDLPWRHTSDPYKIWLSEIILQQTRVEQGMNYYYRFIETFPNIESLANAHIDEILRLWQGLGYYNRAKNLHQTAQKIHLESRGFFPSTYQELLQLKGVGPYTAAAIASFAFNEPVAVVDGNVKRVIARLFAIDQPINKTPVEKEIQSIADDIINKNEPATHNQAMIEFGATQCTPKLPQCSACPLNEFCQAYKTNRVQDLPVKTKPKVKKNRYFYYLVIKQKNQTLYIRQRTNADVWNSLYEFPLIERQQEVPEEEIPQSPEWEAIFKGLNPKIHRFSKQYKHVLSHQNIFATFIEISIENSNSSLKKYYTNIHYSKLDQFAISRLIERYLNDPPP